MFQKPNYVWYNLQVGPAPYFVLGGTKPSRKVSGSKYAMGVLKTVIEYGLESFRGVNIYGLESFRDV